MTHFTSLREAACHRSVRAEQHGHERMETAAEWAVRMGRDPDAELARIKRLADADWNALASEMNPRLHAAQHLAEMDPARRAEIEKDFA